jgi:ubiquinone/menaquinone biosynthesis C-methylase UbiE
MTDLTKARYFEALERTGITQHPGGLDATRRLAKRIYIVPRQRILDIGCGTDYTACSPAKKYRVDVVAVDFRPRILEWAKQRVNEEGVGEKVTPLVEDAHALPFPMNALDAVLTESVLVFTDPKRAASEMHHVLKPGAASAVTK